MLLRIIIPTYKNHIIAFESLNLYESDLRGSYNRISVRPLLHFRYRCVVGITGLASQIAYVKSVHFISVFDVIIIFDVTILIVRSAAGL